MNSKYLTEYIKAEALRLGFFACGIAKASKVDDFYANQFLKQINTHNFSDMHYMYENVEKRLDPQLLVPDGRRTLHQKESRPIHRLLLRGVDACPIPDADLDRSHFPQSPGMDRPSDLCHLADGGFARRLPLRQERESQESLEFQRA